MTATLRQRNGTELDGIDTIYLYNEPLRISVSQRHLGVAVSSDLRWTLHIDQEVSRASRF